MNHDPNGESYEAFIERMAGASPPEAVTEAARLLIDEIGAVEGFLIASGDWPQPKPPPFPADDEGEAVPDD